MSNFLQDIRYAFRGLRKSPGFAAIAVLTLALGIGANTAIFTVVNAVFFHPLPVKDPSSLVEVFTTDQRKIFGPGADFLPVSYPNAEDIRQRAQSFSGLVITVGAPVSMTVNGLPDQYFALLASGNYFDVVGVHAALGRTFLPQEDAQPGGGPVIVLNHGFWERKFASDPGVIGKSVLLNGQGFTIIGVAPAGFQGTATLGGPDMWVPMSMHDQVLTGLFKALFTERRFVGFNLFGRLKSESLAGQARSELQTIGSDLERAFPVPNAGRSFVLLPILQSSINPNQRGIFERAGALIMAIVGIVLLVACFNIANLLLARASGRKREISIRVALGASRSRIVMQLLTEAMVLALAGGLLGLGLAVIGRNILWQFRPPQFPLTGFDLSLDAHVLFFTILVALGTGIAFGLAPALQSSKPNLVTELKERTGGDLHGRRGLNVRDVLVIVQVAISLVALVGAGLFLISLRNAQGTDAGFDTNNLGMLSFDLGSLNYDAARAKEFERRVLETVQAVPGVKSAALSTTIPLFNGGFGRTVFLEGEAASDGQKGQVAQFSEVSPEYLQTMGISLLRGQWLDNSVRENTVRAAVINESAARRFWPNQDPIGKRFKVYRDTELTQVIGVARDSKYNTLGEGPTPYVYLPLTQVPRPGATVFFRAQGPTGPVLNMVRAQVQALDRNLPLTNVWPIGEVISQALWAARFGASLLAVFAMIAMALCAVGIYGVVGYSVGQRVREFGIRLALGARPTDVMMMVLRQSALTLGVGLGAGLMAAFLLARLVVTFLYGVSATSPLAFLGTALVLAAVGVLASYIPARRAARVDPMVALHQE